MHISVGDLLREEIESTSSGFAEFIKDSIRNSVIIPADFSVRLIQKRIQESKMETKFIVILDGFPRSLDQAHAFEEKVVSFDMTSDSYLLSTIGPRKVLYHTSEMLRRGSAISLKRTLEGIWSD